jgi:membrane protease YdiL (CAAX protease family)
MVRKLLLICGIASSVLYIATDVLGALIYPGYSYIDHTISELSAIGAPSRPFVVPLFSFYPPLVLLFAIGVWLAAGNRRAVHAIAGLLVVYAFACIPFAPMHTREVLAAGGGTWTDTMHLVMTAIDSLLLMSMILIGAWTFGRGFRVYSIITLIVILGCGAFTGMHGADVSANQQTPWIGVTERITVFGAMLWLATFATALLRTRSFAGRRVAPRLWMQRHPAVTYFALTFLISWGGIVAVVGPSNILASKQVFDSYVWVPPLVLGPCVAGILATWLVGGRSALREYRARLLRWRVDARWYAIALLTAPIYYTATSLLLSLWSPAYLPNIVVADDRATLLVQGTIIALSAGIFEELGWTGFAVPTLRRRYSPTTTGLIVGVLWGLWHVLPETLGARAFEFVPYLALQLVAVIVGLTGYRILMVWVYERTRSTLIGILMHAGLTGSLMLLQPVVIGRSLLLVGIVLDLVPWLAVAVIAIVMRRRSRPSLSWPTSATPRHAH